MTPVQPVERIQRHARTRALSTGIASGCSTGFGAGNTNRCACSRHASRSGAQVGNDRTQLGDQGVGRGVDWLGRFPVGL
jgi:hypothetical protein